MGPRSFLEKRKIRQSDHYRNEQINATGKDLSVAEQCETVSENPRNQSECVQDK